MPDAELQAVATFLVDNDKKIELRIKIGLKKHLTTYYFCQKQYSKCIDYINQISEFKLETNDFYYFDICMLFIISYLEMGNTLIIENNVRNVYRKLRDYDLLQPHQKCILLAFKNLYANKITIKNYQLFYDAIVDTLQQERTLYYLQRWIEQKLHANKIYKNTLV